MIFIYTIKNISIGFFIFSDIFHFLCYCYLILALSTFFPVLMSILEKDSQSKKDIKPSYSKSKYFNNLEKKRLEQHFYRYNRTLKFWRNKVSKYTKFHYYCIFWTIPASIITPVLTQLISGSNTSKLLLTIISTHVAILLTFHRSFKVNNMIVVFRKGESNFYDHYRKILDNPTFFGNTTEEQLKKFFLITEDIRKSNRYIEVESAIPDIENQSST